MVNKKVISFIAVTYVVVAVATSAVIINNVKGSSLLGLNDDPYVLELNRSLSQAELTAGEAVFNTANNNPITFSFDSSKSQVTSGGVIDIMAGGYFQNDTRITGINRIEAVLSGGSATLSYGNYPESLSLGGGVLDAESGTDVPFSVDLSTPCNYFSLHDVEGEIILKNLKITYACTNDTEPESILKTSVFADVQLTYKESGDGYSANSGSTSHAFLSLKNHFELCKEQDVDVIFMGGDIVNNAISKYYELYQETFESVYGTDESAYPEVIWLMGNHEWWDKDEHDTAQAVSLYNQYSRIDTPNLVKQTSVKYYLDNTVNLPTFYKVVNGVPFLAISGENCRSEIGEVMQQEIATWLTEIEALPSVQNGGPIYVTYHLPLSFTMTHGRGSSAASAVLEELLSDYPQAVVFTGDTHYSGINERAISQADFTAINIGSSSYSRMDQQSATMTGEEAFYNLKDSGGESKDVMTGNAQFKYEYTPTIHMMETYDNGATKIDRYFSTEDPENPIHINNSWYLEPDISKSAFTYTNARFQNTAAANELYGANGLSWESEASVSFGINNGKMLVSFPDVVNYHYCEHFQIEVTSDTSNKKVYDVVSNYYKYSPTPENLYFVLEDLPEGSSYSIKVTAFDYFDNPSLNFLTSNAADPATRYDEIDNQLSLTYSDISTRMNLDEHTPDSKSSVEYYYKGVQRYNYGAILNRVLLNEGVSAADYLSIESSSGVNTIVKAKVKNLTPNEMTVGLIVVDGNGSWKSDFGSDVRKSVPANSDWVSLEWDLTNLFGITGRSEMSHIGIKANSSGYNADDGYEMHFLMDDIDIVEDGAYEVVRGHGFNAGVNFAYDYPRNVALNEQIVIDIKFTTAATTKVELFLGQGWASYFGVFQLYANGTLGGSGSYDGVSVVLLEDGYYRYTFDLDSITKTTDGSPQYINLVYIRGVWGDASGYIDVNPVI
ncbi:MAG: metallophosphoesterase [Synergistaceae bacterium]